MFSRPNNTRRLFGKLWFEDFVILIYCDFKRLMAFSQKLLIIVMACHNKYVKATCNYLKEKKYNTWLWKAGIIRTFLKARI